MPPSKPCFALTVLSLILSSLIAAGPAHAADTAAAPLPPIESFFENANFSGAVLSPDGTHLAAKLARAGQHDTLAVIDLSTNGAKVVASFSDSDIGDFSWVNDERMLYDVADKDVAQRDTRNGPGLYAVNRDSSNFRQLARRSASLVSEHIVGSILPWNTFMLGQRAAQDSQFVYVRSPQYDEHGALQYVNLLRLDTLTGRAVAVTRPADTRAWLLDQHGEPRIATALELGQEVLYYRANIGKPSSSAGP